MSYKITIEKTVVETKVVRGQHEEEVKSVENIYKQTVEDLDIIAVINAVNKGE